MASPAGSRSPRKDTGTEVIAPEADSVPSEGVTPIVQAQGPSEVRGETGKRGSKRRATTRKAPSNTGRKPKRSAPIRRLASRNTDEGIPAVGGDSLPIQPSERSEYSPTSREVQLLRTEVLHRFDAWRRDAAIQRSKDDEEKAAAKKRDDAWKKDMLTELKLIRMGVKETENDTNMTASVKTLAEIAKEYVKLKIALDFLDASGGRKLFDAASRSASEDSTLVIEAASFALESLPANSENADVDLRRFLSKTLTVRKNKKDCEQRVGIYISQGMNRAQDAIRNELISEFMAVGSTEDSTISVLASKKSSREDKQAAAKALCTGGSLIANIALKDAWSSAWLGAQSEAFTTANSAATHLKAQTSSERIPSVPDITADNYELGRVSPYAIGFVIMKVYKFLESQAGLKSKGYRTSHEPYWAKYTLELNDELKRTAGVMEDPCRSGDDVDIGLMRETVVWGDLTVNGLLYADEVAELGRKKSV